MIIPLIDLKRQNLSIKNEIDDIFDKIINSSQFILGDYVNRFEKQFAAAHGAKYCLGCGNGTDAIYITLRALGIGAGDEVITTALSWISTSETISQTGARVVFCDIEEKSFTIDPEKIEKLITSKTKAIIPVHLYGHPANMTKINEIADYHGLHIIEDCAQSHFAEWNNQKVGNFGIAGTFSFYPSKNLGALGDAGAIISNDKSFINRARKFSNHGSSKKNFHDIEGINSRLDGLQAAVLTIKLKYISDWNNKRKSIFNYYNKSLLKLKKIDTPIINDKVVHGYHQYVIRTPKRNELFSHLVKNNINVQIHYPKPLPMMKAYEYLCHKDDDFKVANRVTNEIISLPFFPEITENELDFIINKINNFF